MVPLPAFALDRLREVDKQGDRVTPLICQRCMVLAKNWKPERDVPLSDLRNMLMNTARRNPLWQERLIEQYVGHADPSVTGKHYQSTDPIELFELFENGTIPLLNAEIEKALEGAKWQKNDRPRRLRLRGLKPRSLRSGHLLEIVNGAQERT